MTVCIMSMGCAETLPWKASKVVQALMRILYTKVWYNITLWYTQQWLFMIIISDSAVSFHTRLLNSSLISSTLDGWQQMAQKDWAGSNNGAIYLCPTLIRSSNDTWGILFNRFLQKKKKTSHKGAINIRSLVCLSHGLYGTSTLLSTTVQIGRLQAAEKTRSECITITKAKSEFLKISHQCQRTIWPFIYGNLTYSIDLHLPFTP